MSELEKAGRRGGGREGSKIYGLKETYAMDRIYLDFDLAKQTVKYLYDTTGKIKAPTRY